MVVGRPQGRRNHPPAEAYGGITATGRVIGLASGPVPAPMAGQPPARLGVLLPDPAGVPDAELPPRLRALLRLARSQEIFLIHTGDGPGAPRTERALWPLLEPPGPWAVVVARPMGAGTPAAPRPEGADERWLRVSVELTPPTSPDARLPAPAVASGDLSAPSGNAPWGVAATRPEDLTRIRRQLRDLRPAWVRMPFHLLNAPLVGPLVDGLRSDGIRLVADDPFAGGLLDGGWLSGSPLEAPGPPRDLDWAATRQRLAPVAALGYLTEGRGRTLPAVALSYLRGRPGVEAVLLRVRSARDFQVLAAPALVLDATDRRRIEGQTSAAPAGDSP
jgi:hypothetical protein